MNARDDLQTIIDDAWWGAQGYHFSGRLTEQRPAPEKDDGRLASLYLNTRMLLTSGEEGMVTWRVAGLHWSARVDDHGYWELASNHALGLAPGWHEISAEPAGSSPAALFVPDPRNKLGLISDIDDTILVSEVLSKTRLLSNSLTCPAESRIVVEGMAPLYRRLLAENPAPTVAPVFYVSGSPRQLTDSIRRFLAAHDFPRGVLQLKELSTERGDSLKDTVGYKRRHIGKILAAFPSVRFLLIGDDGESDPEIYADIAERYPDRVAGIWIRRVHTDPERPRFKGQRDIVELLPGQGR